MILHEMRKTPRYAGAMCGSRHKQNILCAYRRDLFRSSRSTNVDQCINCGKRQYYHVKNGRIDIQRYKRDHIADYIQRGSPLFELIYGKPTEIKKRKTQEQISENIFDNVYDAVRRAKRLENKGLE